MTNINILLILTGFIFLVVIFVLLIINYNKKTKEKFITRIEWYPIIKDNSGTFINPILWYKFDGSSSFLNCSINNANNLINTGATFDNTNFVKGDGSIKFSLSSLQFVRIPKNFNWNAINTTNGISVSLWIKMNSDSNKSYTRIFDFGETFSDGVNSKKEFALMSYTNTNNLWFIISRRTSSSDAFTTDEYMTSGFNCFDGVWRHITWTITTDGVWTIYINGSQVFTGRKVVVQPIDDNNFANNNLARSIWLNETQRLSGNIDDFRIYDRVLTQDQVDYLYNGPTQEEIDAENARVRAEGRKNAILNSIRASADAYNSELTSQTTSLEITSELQKYPSGILDLSSVSSTPQVLNRNLRFGNQEYEIFYSSYDENNRNNTPINLFNGNIDNSAIIDSDNPNSDLIGGSFSSYRDSGYDLTSGNYIGQKSLTINGTQINGEAVYIKAPSAFIIRKYGFVALTGNENYAPGKWMLFGTNETINTSGTTNIQATLIDDATGSQLSRVNYLNKYSWYLKTIPAPTPPTGFTTYLFIFTATARSDLNIGEYDYNKLNFSEITIYGHPPATTTS